MTEARLLVSEAHRSAQSLDDALRLAHAGADPVSEIIIYDLLESASAIRLRLYALLSALRDREADHVATFGPDGMFQPEVTP